MAWENKFTFQLYSLFFSTFKIKTPAYAYTRISICRAPIFVRHDFLQIRLSWNARLHHLRTAFVDNRCTANSNKFSYKKSHFPGGHSSIPNRYTKPHATCCFTSVIINLLSNLSVFVRAFLIRHTIDFHGHFKLQHLTKMCVIHASVNLSQHCISHYILVIGK